MTSATERTDDDVIVITDAQVVDSPRTDADETSVPADHEVPEDSDLEAGDMDLKTDDEQLGSEEPADDELGASGERADYLTTSGDATADGAPSGSSAFAMPGGDPSTDSATADSAADSTASADSGPFVVPSTDEDDSLADDDSLGEPDDSLAEPDNSLAEPAVADTSPDGSLAEPEAAGTSAADPSPAAVDTSAADISAADTSSAGTSPVAPSSVSQPDGNWPEIQSMFVDDPRSAVERAAEVTGAALAGLVAAAKDREQSLRSGWEADGTGTEELRTSLQHYRELATRLTELSQEL
jgi:hypothetical protein